jgi:hypothetical protein
MKSGDDAMERAENQQAEHRNPSNRANPLASI